jgi:hypothetical protein
MNLAALKLWHIIYSDIPNIFKMENPARPENKEANNHLTSDTSEIVRRHLEDRNHEITDEEIRNIRVVGEDDNHVIVGEEAEANFLGEEAETDNSAENNSPDKNNASVTRGL